MQEHQQKVSFLSSFKNIFFSKKEDVIAVADEQHEAYANYHRPNTDAHTDKPMATRTVDFSHTEFVPLSNPDEKTMVGEQTPCQDMSAAEKLESELDIKFALNLIEKGGKFMYCESIKNAIDELRRQVEENHWRHVFCWENEIKDAFQEYDFQRGVIGYTIENSDAAMCLCEALIADSGALLLNSKQASRRRLPVFPKTQIFLADISQLHSDLSRAILHFSSTNKGELPSIMDLSDNVKGHFYHEKNTLILKAEGPENVYVFLVDEKIPVSLRA